MRKIVSATMIAMLSVSAFAAKKNKSCKHGFSPTEKNWIIDALFGYGSNTGNTVNSNMNSAVKVNYSPDLWEFIVGATAQFQTQNHQRTVEKYTQSFETRYHFMPKENFFYGLANGTENPFNSYDRVYTGSAGYGWTIVDNCLFYSTWQFGPGYRYERDASTKHGDSRPVGYTQFQFTWYINKKTHFKQQITVEYSNQNTYTETVTSVQTRLVGHFGMKASYETDYNTHIPTNSSNNKKLDTTTIVGLTYTFDS